MQKDQCRRWIDKYNRQRLRHQRGRRALHDARVEAGLVDQFADGDEIAFLVTSGDRRLMDLGDVRERSNVIRVVLRAAGVAVPLGGEGPHPSPGPSPSPTPGPGPAPEPQPDLVSQLAARMTALEGYAARLFEALTALSATTEQHRSVVETLGARVQALEARPVWARCSAAVAMFQIHIPVRCQLQGP